MSNIFCSTSLASYACNYKNSKGRLYSEKDSKNRSPFQRDRDRIIHSLSFRRLEYKTQVFVNFESDHFRTRLTHSLEVAQIARAISKKLGLDQDLAEAISLAHDMGHPPFGHAGEDALNVLMKRFDGYDHNDQLLKILIKLESPYAEYDGLNLTFETLEGIVKHNGAIVGKTSPIITKFNQEFNFELSKNTCLEAQISSLSDDIAYNNHDIDDGFRANLLKEEDFIDIPLVNEAICSINKKYPLVAREKKLHEVRRIIYSKMVDDVIERTLSNIKKHNIKTCSDIREIKIIIANFSPEMKIQVQKLKALLKNKIYTHPKIQLMYQKAHRIITDIFHFYMAHPECLEEKLYNKFSTKKRKKDQARVICDYIAGMTDRFAFKHHKELFDIYEFNQKFA